MRETWTQRLFRGGVAGLAGGLASALVLWIVVEPALSRAIALEGGADGGHDHGAHAHGGHSHGEEEIVTRLQQQIGGTLTVIVVGALFGLAFAVIYAKSRHRLPGATDLGKSLALASITAVVMVLLPALLAPANPPGVGDPATVNARTLTYVAVLALGAIAVCAVFAVHRALGARGGAPEVRWILTAGAAIGLTSALLWVGPSVNESVPAHLPADLLWQFRLGSIAQLTAMWLLIGVVHGYLQQRRAVRSETDLRSFASA